MEPEHISERPGSPEHLLATWRRHLVTRQLHHRPVLIENKFVSAVEIRVVCRHTHLRPDSKGVDRGAPAHQVVDRELVETSAGEDAHLAQAGAVQQPPCRFGQRGEVSTVKPDPEPPLQPELMDHLDGGIDAGDGVVGVDQEGGSAWKVFGKGAESVGLAAKGFHVGVSHRPGRDKAESPCRLDIARRGKAHHGGQARHVDPGLDPMGAPEREVDGVSSSGCHHAARGLARDRRLVGHAVEQERFDQLRLRQRRCHLDQRLARERDPPFAHRPHVTGEAKAPEGFQVRGGEAETVPQVAQVLLFESQLLEKVQARLDARGDDEPSHHWQPAHEEAEGCHAVHMAAQVAGHHVQLVQVGEQCVHADARSVTPSTMSPWDETRKLEWAALEVPWMFVGPR